MKINKTLNNLKKSKNGFFNVSGRRSITFDILKNELIFYFKSPYGVYRIYFNKNSLQSIGRDYFTYNNWLLNIKDYYNNDYYVPYIK